MNPTISFVVLTWNSQPFVAACLDSIDRQCSQEQIPYEVLLIDNGSTDKTNDIVGEYAKRRDNIVHIKLPRNCGTTATRNRGIKKSRGDYICILDSDTEFKAGSLASSLRVLGENPDVGMLAPRLVLPDGTVQNSVKKFPTFWNKMLKLPKAVLKIKVRDGDFYTDFPFESETLIDTAISACWIFNKSLIDKIGYLDEKIFYSPEDLDFSIRVWLGGLKILYYPALTLLHNTQQISHAKPFSKVSRLHFSGLLYYYRKHGGWLSRKHVYKKIGRNR
jgi:GT2 family glycosyltransferase